MIGQNEQLQQLQDRFRYVYIVLGLMATILFLRVWYLQIIKGPEFKQFAEENRLKRIKIEAPRGMIFDRDRDILLDNHPTFNATITPQYFRAANVQQREVTLQRLAQILKMNPKSIQDVLTRNRRNPSFQAVTIKRNLSMDEVALIEMEKLSLPGVEVATGIRRTNVNGKIGSHLLGYIAEIDGDELPRVNRTAKRPYSQGDSIGKSGLELQLENVLRGEDGVEFVEVDAFGRKKVLNERNRQGKLVGEIPPRPAIPGKNVVLTIDDDLQKAAAEQFIKDDKTGAVVAIDPRNGEVLAMLSWPSFDSTEFSVGIRPEYWRALSADEDKPLRDKTILDHYSPGSTFKIISALAGLEEGLITENTVVPGAGSFKFGGRVWHDWKKEGHGPTEVIKSLYRSVDVYFYKLATRLEIDRLAYFARELGLGQRTGLELPGEIPGRVPDTAWKKRATGHEWFPGETLSVIIGQGPLDATPIQLANMIAGIAVGGTIYKPRLVKRIEDQEGNVLSVTQPEKLHDFKFNAKNMELVRKGLIAVVEHEQGTAKGQFIPGLRIAGKTGTSQVIRFTADTLFKDCKHLERRFRHHGLYVAFAPVDDPKIAVAVVAEHSCSGSSGAAPIATAVIKRYLAKLYPEKYGEEALKQARVEYWKNRSRGAASGAASGGSEE
jgi:penicillin-binding protein 2